MNILREAEGLVYGDRQKQYSHPSSDYAKTAKMWTGILLEKLRPDIEITAKEAVLMMVAMKISREQFKHKRDNIVDGIGYFVCAARIENDE